MHTTNCISFAKKKFEKKFRKIKEECDMRGRPSNEVIENRILLGVGLLKEYNFKIGEKQFRDEYKLILKENNFTIPKDSRTIATDKEKIEKRIRNDYGREVQWVSAKVEKPKPNSIFSQLGSYVSDKIRKVYLCTGDKEYVLYRGNKKFQTMKCFKEPVMELYKMRKEKSMSGDTLVRIYIVFNEDGYEEMTSDFFNQNGKHEKVLFTCIHQFCTEIVSELRYLKTITEDIYYVIYP